MGQTNNLEHERRKITSVLRRIGRYLRAAPRAARRSTEEPSRGHSGTCSHGCTPARDHAQSHRVVTLVCHAVRHASYPAVAAFARAVFCPVRFNAFDVLTPLIVAHLKRETGQRGVCFQMLNANSVCTNHVSAALGASGHHGQVLREVVLGVHRRLVAQISVS